MNREMFKESAGQRTRGRRDSARRESGFANDFDPRFRGPGHSRANQPVTIGVCAFSRRQREDASELGNKIEGGRRSRRTPS